MFISKQILKAYTAEIANFNYSVTLDNGLAFHLKEQDLVEFIHYYIPSIQTSTYLPDVTAFIKHGQAVDLVFYVRFCFDELFKDHYSFQLFDLEFDANRPNGYCFDGFVDMKASGDLDKFFDIGSKITADLKDGNRQHCTYTPFSKRNWAFFPDRIVLDDAESTVFINETTVQKIAAHIKDDFETNGSSTLDYLKSHATARIRRPYVSVDFFLEHFDHDLNALKHSDGTYEQFCHFLHKYQLPEEPV